MNAQTQHLTEEQFYTLIDGPEVDQAASQHLLACSDCSAEVANLRESLTNFRLAATGISLAQVPLRPPTRVARTRFFPMPQTAWAAALTASVALCIGSISILHRPAAGSIPASPTVAVATAAGETQSDDALLQDIDQDLSTSVPPSLAPLDIASTSAKTTTNSN
jgi:anti-sigma factor RsiW